VLVLAQSVKPLVVVGLELLLQPVVAVAVRGEEAGSSTSSSEPSEVFRNRRIGAFVFSGT